MAATYEPIASTTLGSDTASVTFSGIAADWTDLVLVTSCRSSRAAASDDIYVQFNGDTGSNYSRTYVYGNGSSALSGRGSNVTKFYWAYVPANSATAGVYSADVLHIMSYANTNVYKTGLSLTSDAGVLVQRQVGLWRSTSAITSIFIDADAGDLKAGSTFSLFGIKAAA